MDNETIYSMLKNYEDVYHKCNDISGGECGHLNTVEDQISGDTVCMDCGFVVGEKSIDMDGEYMGPLQNKSQSNSRVTNFSHNKGLLNNELSSTMISIWKDKKNLRRWHNCITMTSQDRSLLGNYNIIESHCQNLNLTPNTTYIAKLIYKKCSDVKISRGAMKKSLIGSCIYVACSCTNTNMSLQTISGECLVDTKYMSKTNKFVYKTIWESNDFKTVVLNHKGLDDHLFHFCSLLNITGKSLIKVKNYSDNILENHPNILTLINERSYIIMAILFIYLVKTDSSLKKSDFCSKFNISQITLTKSVRVIQDNVLIGNTPVECVE